MGTFDSVLAFVEANWRLENLTQRDAAANNLMDAFRFNDLLEPAPALILPLMKEPQMTPAEVQALNDQVLQDRVNDDDDAQTPE